MARATIDSFSKPQERPLRSFTPQVDNTTPSTGSETSGSTDVTDRSKTPDPHRNPDDPFYFMYSASAGHPNNKDIRDEEYLMALEARYQKTFMDYENAYNSPKEQMQRYMEAGLNPNMIYDKDQHGASGSAPSHNNPSTQSVANKISSFNSLSAMAKGVNDIRMQNAQISSLEYDNELKKAQAITERHRAITEIFNSQVRAKEVDEVTERIKKMGAETWNEKLRSVLLNAEIKNIPISRALQLAGLSNSYIDIAVKSAQMIKTLAEKNGIEYDTAIKQYTYEKILPLQRQAQMIENDKHSFQSFLDQTYGVRDRQYQGNGIVDKLFNGILSTPFVKNMKQSVQKESQSYIPGIQEAFYEWQKKYTLY